MVERKAALTALQRVVKRAACSADYLVASMVARKAAKLASDLAGMTEFQLAAKKVAEMAGRWAIPWAPVWACRWVGRKAAHSVVKMAACWEWHSADLMEASLAAMKVA